MKHSETYVDSYSSTNGEDIVKLAAPVQRLFATILDNLFICVPAVAIYVFARALPFDFHKIDNAVFGLAAYFTLFLLMNGYLLHQYGQTVGKRLMKIKIVMMDDNPAPLWRLVLLRHAPFTLLASLPSPWQLAWYANVLLIFREGHRCGHDVIAGTKVVDAS
jgi:uncharacterized RDD family membrane protein YckC